VIDVWKTFCTTFGIMLLAEIGDKTQLAVVSLTTRHRSPWVVFTASTCALVVATGIGVALGSAVTAVAGERAVRSVSGGLFVLFGVLILAGK
jgi:putative Ca2+/H+ antiporter (TMEM165/GDT1 family)